MQYRLSEGEDKDLQKLVSLTRRNDHFFTLESKLGSSLFALSNIGIK